MKKLNINKRRLSGEIKKQGIESDKGFYLKEISVSIIDIGFSEYYQCGNVEYYVSCVSRGIPKYTDLIRFTESEMNEFIK